MNCLLCNFEELRSIISTDILLEYYHLVAVWLITKSTSKITPMGIISGPLDHGSKSLKIKLEAYHKMDIFIYDTFLLQLAGFCYKRQSQ